MAKPPRHAWVGGVGMTSFRRPTRRSLSELGREACVDALRGGGLMPESVQGAYCGSAVGAGLQGGDGIG